MRTKGAATAVDVDRARSMRDQDHQRVDVRLGAPRRP